MGTTSDGATDSGIDFLTSLRLEALEGRILPGSTSLEIGAFTRPTLRPPTFRTSFLDFYSTADLRKHCGEIGIDPDLVMPVDYVVKGEDYSTVVDQKFGIVLANHVLEHISNPILWLNMIADMIEEQGLLFISLPDKKFSFDRFREETQLSHIVADYLVEGRDILSEHCIETEMYYDREYAGLENSLETSLSVDKLRGAAGNFHPGIHCHVFGGGSFLNKIIRPLIHMQLIPFSVVDYREEQRAGEFYTLLRKSPEAETMTKDAFFSNLAG